ncbi:MAG: recombinase family protein [Lentisphaeria bacterium]|nr:recombinase family protein [Lentisphaeria bacterium]
MKMKAVIYARQSSGSDDYSESVEVQIANCQRLAAAQQLEIVNIFSDLNISGKTYPAGWETLAGADRAFQHWAENNSSGKLFRSGFGRVFRMLNTVNYIIVDDITRLYRPLSRSYLENAVNQALIEHNVKIIQVKGGTLDLSMFDQQLITMLKNQINDEQIAKQRQRSIEVFNKLRDSGVMPTGITAFALDYDRVSKCYTVDGEKSEVVKFIFQSILDRNSYSSIIKEVNLRWKHYFNGCFWNKTLYEIVRKPIYAGYQYSSTGELIPNSQGNGIIPLADFLQVQEIIRQKRFEFASRSSNNARIAKYWLPLSGLLYCGNCGSKLVVAVEKGKISYRCRKGLLLDTPGCRSSRIVMYCNKPHITGALEAVQTVFGYALLERQKKMLEADFFEKLIENYRNNSLSKTEYEMLLNECVERIDVYNDYINVKTTSGEVQLERRVVLRQKGFSLNKLSRLRRKILAEMNRE